MRLGMLFNAIVCLLIASACFLSVRYIYKNNKLNRSEISFIAFWFLVGCTWGFMFISLLLGWQNQMRLDLLLNKYIVQTLIFMQITAASYFVYNRIIKNENIVYFIVYLYAVSTIVGLYFIHLPNGFAFKESSYFSIEYSIHPKAWLVFQIIAVSGLLTLLADAIMNIINYLKNQDYRFIKIIFLNLTIILYGIVGYFDQQGVSTNWTMVLFRLLMFFAALSVYMVYSQEELSKD